MRGDWAAQAPPSLLACAGGFEAVSTPLGDPHDEGHARLTFGLASRRSCPYEARSGMMPAAVSRARRGGRGGGCVIARPDADPFYRLKQDLAKFAQGLDEVEAAERA